MYIATYNTAMTEWHEKRANLKTCVYACGSLAYATMNNSQSDLIRI